MVFDFEIIYVLENLVKGGPYQPNLIFGGQGSNLWWPWSGSASRYHYSRLPVCLWYYREKQMPC